MRKHRGRAPLIFALLATLAAAPAEGRPLAASEREQVLAAMAKAEPGLAEDALAVWRFAEVGYQETRSSAQLQKRLRENGFQVKAGVAEMPTAFVASFKTGEAPVIGLLAEFDALPGLAQAAVAQQQPNPGQAAGHGCGHNLFGAASVAAAIALKSWMQANGVKGEIRVYGSPAEEGGNGKVYLVRAGLFDGVDAVVNFHPDDHNTASQPRTLANMGAKFRFHGASAHAAGRPDEGVSALDAVQLMNFAVEQLREHVPDGTRIHYVITNGGKAPNVVPDFAESYYYVRNLDPKVVRAIWEKVRRAGEGAALATGTRLEVEITAGTYAMLPNRALMQVMDESLRGAPVVPWTPDDLAFAQKISATLARKDPLDQAAVRPAEFGKTLYGSTDVADVSWVVPTAGMEIMTWVPGTPGHSWQAAAASGAGIGVKGGILAARTMALAGARLLVSPETIAEAKAELLAVRGADFRYVPMSGDRKPPLDYRSAGAGGR